MQLVESVESISDKNPMLDVNIIFSVTICMCENGTHV